MPRPLAPLALALVLAACSAPSAPPPVAERSPEADSARAILTRVSPALAAEAVRRLDDLAYTADVRLEELDGEGHVTESAGRRVRRAPGPDGRVRERLVASDSGAGLPARGAFGPLRLSDPVARMLPDEPPHLAARTRERYAFRLLPTTEANGRRINGAEASLRDPKDREPVRRVRAWIDVETGAPYAVEVWRESRSAIFDESGRAGVFLQPGPDGAPVPARALAESTIDIPFGPPRHLRLALWVREIEG